jgi:hypothetical protein
MADGSKGAVVVPGSPDESPLWTLVRDGKMSMGGAPLTDEEKVALVQTREFGGR